MGSASTQEDDHAALCWQALRTTVTYADTQPLEMPSRYRFHSNRPAPWKRVSVASNVDRQSKGGVNFKRSFSNSRLWPEVDPSQFVQLIGVIVEDIVQGLYLHGSPWPLASATPSCHRRGSWRGRTLAAERPTLIEPPAVISRFRLTSREPFPEYKGVKALAKASSAESSA